MEIIGSVIDMKINEILYLFNEYFLEFDSKTMMVNAIYPNLPVGSIPCSIKELNASLNNSFDDDAMQQIYHFLTLKDKSEGISIKLNDKWIAIDFKESNGKEYAHIYECETTVERMKDVISTNQLDSLTQVLHRKAIEKFINDRIEINKIDNATIFMVDIDYFKNINDHYGHVFGDKVIVAISKALQAIEDYPVIVSRMGGDEFIVYIEELLVREEIKLIARQIRYNLDNLVIDGNRFSVTSTIGIVKYPENGKTFTELYEKCDKALYRGKTKGRDCHIIYDPLLHENIKVSTLDYQSINKLSIAVFINNITSRLMDPDISEVRNIFKDIALFFQLDRIIAVFENRCVCFYENNQYGNSYNEYLKLDLEEYRKYFITDNSLSINDFATWISTDENVFKVFKKSKMISAVQVMSFNKDNKVSGMLSYESIKNRRVWQNAEINYLIILSGLLKTLYK